MTNFYSIKHNSEIRYYSNLKKLCETYNIEYDNVYYAIVRQKRGFYQNDEFMYRIYKLKMNDEDIGIDCECGGYTEYGFGTLCSTCIR